MSHYNRIRRKVAWDKEKKRAFVSKEGTRYWAPEHSRFGPGDDVSVLNPTHKSATVKGNGREEQWSADATSGGERR